MSLLHPVLAHAGHVLIDVPIFLGPVFVLGGALWLANWRERRAGHGDSGDEGPAES